MRLETNTIYLYALGLSCKRSEKEGLVALPVEFYSVLISSHSLVIIFAFITHILLDDFTNY